MNRKEGAAKPKTIAAFRNPLFHFPSLRLPKEKTSTTTPVIPRNMRPSPMDENRAGRLVDRIHDPIPVR